MGDVAEQIIMSRILDCSAKICDTCGFWSNFCIGDAEHRHTSNVTHREAET